MVLEMKIIKQELEFEECLKQRLEFICEFSKVTPTFINGSIRKLEKTNLTYIEPHRVIIKNITFLVFNYSNDVYISNLTKKIKLSELEEYFNEELLYGNQRSIYMHEIYGNYRKTQSKQALLNRIQERYPYVESLKFHSVLQQPLNNEITELVSIKAEVGDRKSVV